MTVEWTSRARSDLAGIYSYLAESAEMVPHIVDRLYAAVQSLAAFPERGRNGSRIGTRELIVAPYVIVYRVGRNLVRIMLIEHGARRR